MNEFVFYYGYWYFQQIHMGHSLKSKKDTTIIKAFQEILNESSCKQNKIWVDKGIEFSNGSIESWLQDSDIEMHSTHNVGKSVVAEKLIRTPKDKI